MDEARPGEVTSPHRSRRSLVADRLRRQVRDHPVRSGWLVSFTFWLAYLWYVVGIRGMSSPPVFDEWLYWALGSGITDRIALTDYANTVRGVGLPLVVSWISSGLGLVEPGARGTAVVLSLVCVPLLTAVIAPSLVESLDPRGRRPGLLRIVLFNLFVLAFWRNDTVRLLSDIPALTAFGGGVAVLARFARPERALDGRGGAAVLGAGALLALGANTRPAYLLPVAVAVLAIPILRWGAAIRSTAIVLALVVAGLLVGFAPQIAVNRHQGAGWSVVPSGSSGLASLQLEYGLRYQRYDTYVGPATEYPVPQMNYDNTANLGGLDPTRATSFGRYAQLFAEQPVVIAQTVARHAFNGLDIRWPGTYVDDVHAPTLPTQILNLVFLVAAFGILAIRSWRWWGARGERPVPGPATPRHWPVPTWFVIVLVGASAPVLVSAVEIRFFLGLHLVLGAVVLLSGRASDLPRRTATRVAVVLVAVVLVGAALRFSDSVARTLTPPIPTRSAAATAPR